jgi:putative transposase
MHFSPTVFSSLLKPINRRQFDASVAHHKGDAYAKRLSSWEHLVALVYAQVSGADSLRAISTGFNAQSHQHYHLGARPVARATLSDANARRSPAIFTDLLGQLIAQLGKKARKDADFAMRMIDSTPIPLGKRFACAAHNGRINGLKLHVLFDPETPSPLHTDITPANVNDVSFRDQVSLEAGITYVFDKGYCHYAWWSDIHAAGAFFVTRPKANAGWTIVATRPVTSSQTSKDDGFVVLADHDVVSASQGPKARKFTIPMRLITIKRADGNTLTLITNDKSRPARDIALCYKARWSIELFFKWIKQNLNLSRFIGRSENAVRLQIIVAMIAFVLIQIARKAIQAPLTTQRFRQLIAAFLPTRRSLYDLEKPPPINPTKHQPKIRYQDPNQPCLDWNIKGD